MGVVCLPPPGPAWLFPESLSITALKAGRASRHSAPFIQLTVPQNMQRLRRGPGHGTHRDLPSQARAWMANPGKGLHFILRQWGAMEGLRQRTTHHSRSKIQGPDPEL